MHLRSSAETSARTESESTHLGNEHPDEREKVQADPHPPAVEEFAEDLALAVVRLPARALVLRTSALGDEVEQVGDDMEGRGVGVRFEFFGSLENVGRDRLLGICDSMGVRVGLQRCFERLLTSVVLGLCRLRRHLDECLLPRSELGATQQFRSKRLCRAGVA